MIHLWTPRPAAPGRLAVPLLGVPVDRGGGGDLAVLGAVSVCRKVRMKGFVMTYDVFFMTYFVSQCKHLKENTTRIAKNNYLKNDIRFLYYLSLDFVTLYAN